MGSPKRLDGDIFHFKDSKVRKFASDDEISSQQDLSGDDVKDTIMDQDLLYDSDSDDDDYTLELSSDSQNDTDSQESASDCEPFDDDEIKPKTTPQSFIFEYDEDSNEDYDTTQYQFEPIEQRSAFFKMSLDFIPYAILIFFTLLLCYNMTNLFAFDAKPTQVENSIINHQILMLNDQVSQLMSVKDELGSIKGQLSSMLTAMPTQQTVVKGIQIQKILNKLESLEKRVDTDSKAKTVQLSTIRPKPVTTTHVRAKSSTYFNIANQCDVDPSLTTLPRKERTRKTVSEKILYGYADLIRRIKSKVFKTEQYRSWWDVIRGNHNQPMILSPNSPNSPFNVLSEEPNKLWVNHVSELPVYLSVKLNTPARIKEIGIYQTRLHSLMSSTPRQLSLFVQPVENTKEMKTQLKNHVNQELNFTSLKKQLKSWVRLSEMVYDIHSDQSFQSFPFNPSWISNWEIQNVLIVIHSNWGDEQNVVLDSLRIFHDTTAAPPSVSPPQHPNDDTPYL